MRRIFAQAAAAQQTAPNRRQFLTRSAEVGAIALLAGCAAATPPLTTVAMPVSLLAHPEQNPVPALKPGGTVGIIAPATGAAGQLEQAAAWLAERGFVPRPFAGAKTRSGDYLAADDSARLADLHAAFSDSSVNAIICLRGGYGSMRLLDRIDFALLARNPKPFVGYSDITALLLAIARYAGFVTFHGPMLASDLIVGKQAPTESALFDMLQGRKLAGDWLPHPAQYPLETLHGGVALGRLVGGNLATIGALLGTRYDIDLDHAILFIEDVGETPQKIDRLLTQLRLAGKLAQVKGVLLGDFSEIDDPRAQSDHTAANRRRLRAVWQDLLVPLQVPVLAGWRSGHCNPNLTLPIGAMVRLDADAKQLRLEQDVTLRS